MLKSTQVYAIHDAWRYGGKHHFSVHLPTNDPKQADKTLTVLSNWVP